jgi:hypothetical protein
MRKALASTTSRFPHVSPLFARAIRGTLHVLSGDAGSDCSEERVSGGLPALRLMRRRQVRLLRRVNGRDVRQAALPERLHGALSRELRRGVVQVQGVLLWVRVRAPPLPRPRHAQRHRARPVRVGRGLRGRRLRGCQPRDRAQRQPVLPRVLPGGADCAYLTISRVTLTTFAAAGESNTRHGGCMFIGAIRRRLLHGIRRRSRSSGRRSRSGEGRCRQRRGGRGRRAESSERRGAQGGGGD